MGNMLRRAKSILRTNDFTALYDKGYHTVSEFKIADDLEIDVYILTKKGKDRASADVGLMFTAYNIRRIINILGGNELKKYLEVFVLLFSAILDDLRRKLSHLNTTKNVRKITHIYFELALNSLTFGQN